MPHQTSEDALTFFSVNENCRSSDEVAEVLYSKYGTGALTKCIEAMLDSSLCGMDNLAKSDKFLELIKCLLDILSSKSQILDHWNTMSDISTNYFVESEYEGCNLAFKVLSVIFHSYLKDQSTIPVEKFQQHLRSMYLSLKVEVEHPAVSIISGMIEMAFKLDNEAKIKFLTDLIDFLPPKILLITLCNITDTLSMNCRLVSLILHHSRFWETVLNCFNDVDCGVRKRSLFLVNFLITSPNITFSPEKRLIIEDVLIILETLEETQGHIIQPVLARIPKLYVHCSKNVLDIRWITTIFRRLILQESKMISRWGFQLLLDLPPEAFIQNIEAIVTLEKLLFAHLHNTYLFYRPNFIEKGQSPPIFDQLKIFFSQILCESESSISCHFLNNWLEFLSNTKSSSTPLTMLSHILSKVKLPYEVDVKCVDQLSHLCRTVLLTQPHKVKGVVQGFILQFLTKNCRINSKEMLVSIQTLLDTLFIDFVLDSTHFVWQELSLMMRVFGSSNDMGHYKILKEHLLNEMRCKEFHPKFQGFGLLLAMADDQDLLSDDTVDMLFNPLMNCGINLYVSTYSVAFSASTVNMLLNYFKENTTNSILLNHLQGNCNVIFENCSLFFKRFSEDVLQKNIRSSTSKHEIKQLACLLANLSVRFMKRQNKALLLILDLLLSINCKERELLVMLQCSNIMEALAELQEFSKFPLPDSPGNMHWLLPYLSSEQLLELESSWICFAFLHLSGTESSIEDVCHIFSLAVDSVQKMKSANVIQIVFQFLKLITPTVLDQNSVLFCESFPYTLAVLQDFSNSGTYWDLLNGFCSTMFNPVVMDHPDCSVTVIKTVEIFKDLTNSKGMVMTLVVDHLASYTSCGMRNAAHYIDLLTELTLFGVTQGREKQNQDDLMAYIEHLGGESPVNTVCQRMRKGVPFLRVKVLNILFTILERNPDFSSSIVDFYLESFKSLDKSALQNSLPNRKKIRIAQSLLCILPSVTRNRDVLGVEELLKDMLMCLTLDSQPSVRCFIECCACYILSKHPKTVSLIFETMSTSKTVANSNALLSALFSILYHHISYLSYKNELTQSLLNKTLQKIGVWTCANNHNVRSFACCCLVLLLPVYESNKWELPELYKVQIDFIKESHDYTKLLSKHIEKNAYFSNFNILNDLCLLNIFNSLPQQFNILDNECVSRKELLSFESCMAFPVISGNFMEYPKPESAEQNDYIIRFKDLIEFNTLQKKITPWQIMATNLGIDFDRGCTIKGELVVFASLISKGNNLGGLSRTGEIFGVKTMVVNNLEILNNKDFRSLSMTSEKWIEFEEVPYDTAPTVQYFKKMKQLGYTIVGVEQASDSVSLDKFQFPRKSVLVLGREKDGIPVELLSQLDVCVEIPQLGLIRSLNVHVSASIMIWEYSKQHLFNEQDSSMRTGGC
ncbi:hypothetical protein ACHWQZ_G010182 [Mnemiopsis leidyi]